MTDGNCMGGPLPNLRFQIVINFIKNIPRVLWRFAFISAENLMTLFSFTALQLQFCWRFSFSRLKITLSLLSQFYDIFTSPVFLKHFQFASLVGNSHSSQLKWHTSITRLPQSSNGYPQHLSYEESKTSLNYSLSFPKRTVFREWTFWVTPLCNYAKLLLSSD